MKILPQKEICRFIYISFNSLHQLLTVFSCHEMRTLQNSQAFGNLGIVGRTDTHVIFSLHPKTQSFLILRMRISFFQSNLRQQTTKKERKRKKEKNNSAI